MRLIITHNNADFDAIASLLAMTKLDPQATAVLPSRVNRNVRNFLTLYANLLPAIQEDDLTRHPKIERIYVVDTQTFGNMRGVRPKTPIHIIDHHVPNAHHPAHHEFEGEPLGANTTLLVEKIRRHNVQINSLEATLLMLGIHEDTGSLTYNRTTVRDIQAAAWLLEQGAQLDLVRDFLRHPLQDEQLALYDQLRDSAENIEVMGHWILIATATAEEQVAEISSIAPKLSDLFDPDAMFLLVQMATAREQSVQVVARSSIPEIDVAIIAKQLGGGGHDRAAAALVRGGDIASIKAQIQNLLPQMVKPGVRVAELMSAGRVQTISAKAPISDAAVLMQRSGHEGYPVLDGKKLVGLLTRRAVDRAMNHQMGQQPVASIMEAGQVYVQAEDALETLRQKMMDSGWGQMPVLNEDGTLKGIVTRTDLIRRWVEEPINVNQHTLMLKKLDEALPESVWQLILTIAQQAQRTQIGLYLVGGFVRDLLLDVPNLDIDFVVEGDVQRLAESLCQKYGGDVHFHAQFGTAKWVLETAALNLSNGPAFIDFATARAEFYEQPTALPTVRQSSIKQDLHRRDFTINTMAIRLSPEPMGELLDYYNGQRDLNEGIIRVLHSLSFVDDPTRMVRAIRFEQRLGFKIEPRTEHLLHDALPLLDRVSGERVRHELNLIMAEQEPLRALRRVDQLGILGQVHPQLCFDEWSECAIRALLYAKEFQILPLSPDFDDWRVAMFAVLVVRFSEEELRALGQRLMISKINLDHLLAVRKGYQAVLQFTPETPRSTVIYALESLGEVSWLVNWAAAPFAFLRQKIVYFVREWRHIHPTINGNDLLTLGIKRGPVIGQILREVRRAWLDGEIQSVEQEATFLAGLVSKVE
ncbi:MAG: CBS domain-containing protein [Chloroflexi bacterium]|nr:CBS domain-containing protein [Chloroflexota bacterium]